MQAGVPDLWVLFELCGFLLRARVAPHPPYVANWLFLFIFNELAIVVGAKFVIVKGLSLNSCSQRV